MTLSLSVIGNIYNNISLKTIWRHKRPNYAMLGGGRQIEASFIWNIFNLCWRVVLLSDINHQFPVCFWISSKKDVQILWNLILCLIALGNVGIFSSDENVHKSLKKGDAFCGTAAEMGLYDHGRWLLLWNSFWSIAGI